MDINDQTTKEDLHTIAAPFRFVGETIKILIFLICVPFVMLYVLIHALYTGTSFISPENIYPATWLLVFVLPFYMVFAHIICTNAKEDRGEPIIPHCLVFIGTIFGELGFIYLVNNSLIIHDVFRMSIERWTGYVVQITWAIMLLLPVLTIIYKIMGCFIPHPDKLEGKHFTTTFWQREMRKRQRRKRGDIEFINRRFAYLARMNKEH